jgi:hypothetical protein
MYVYTIHVNEHEVMFNINLIRINLNILCNDRAGRKSTKKFNDGEREM